MMRSVSQVGGKVQYDAERRLYDIQLDSDDGRLLFTGCTGGEIDPKVILNLFITGNWNVELDTRAQVAAGMRMVSENDTNANTNTVIELLGDQIYPNGVPEDAAKAASMLQEEIFDVYKPINATTFLMNGNHEVGGHGKKQKTRALLDQKSQRQVSAVKRADLANFYMPDNYYAQIIRNNKGQVLACVVCADTNSFWYDTDQQTWLMQTIIPLFTKAGFSAPWLWAGHHAFADTIGKRGLKGDGGKYSAPEALHNASLHQINFATAQKIGLDLKRFKVFAAHEHTNYVAINDASSSLPDQFIFGGGGSMSNSLEQVALPIGTKWSACTFGFGEVILTTEGMSIAFIDCTEVDLKSPEKNQLKTLFAAEIRRSTPVVSITQNSGLDRILQKAFKKHFSVLNPAVQDSSSSLALKIACFIWGSAYQQLNALTLELSARGQSSNPLVTLLLLPLLTERAVVSPEVIFQTLEQCLLLFATPINQTFLGVKPFKQLFLTLEACHYCLAVMLSQTLVSSSSVQNILESERPTLDRSIRAFRETNYLSLNSDESDDESDQGDEKVELDEETALVTSSEHVDVISAVCKKSLSAGADKGTKKLEDALIEFLQTFLQHSALLRTLITLAVKQRLNYLYDEYQKNHSRKPLDSKDYFYFIAREDAQVARAYTVDFLLNRLLPNVLIKAVMVTDLTHSADLSAMLFEHLANGFVDMLKREYKKGGETAVNINCIFKCWSSKHSDLLDDSGDELLRQRAKTLLSDYFVGLQLNPSNRAYAMFLKNACVKALWSEDSVWEPKFREHFERSQALVNAFDVWQEKATPTYIQSWINYLGSFFSGDKEENTDTRTSEMVSNPIVQNANLTNP